MEEWGWPQAGVEGAMGPGQQPSYLSILCAHTPVHALYYGGSPFNTFLSVGVSTWGEFLPYPQTALYVARSSILTAVGSLK